MRKPRIVIAGTGVAGSIAAQFLTGRDDIDLICLERASAEDQTLAGTGLNVGPNALKSLASFLPALHALVRRHSLPWSSWRTSLTDGTELMNLDLATVADNPGIRIRWAALYALLRSGIEGSLRFRTSLLAARRAGAGEKGPLAIDIEGPNGPETIEGIDLLVAGDGRYSLVREHLIGRPEPRHFGIALGRILAPLTSPLIGDYEQWFNGPNRLLAFRVPGDASYMTVAFPLPDASAIPDDLRRPEAILPLFLPAGGKLGAQCDWLLSSIAKSADTFHWARLQEADIAFRDPSGHALLLGDAAHPMVPTLGQGATQSMEDACLAGAMIADALTTGFDVPALTAAIEAARRPRIDFAMALSREGSDTLFPGCDPVRDTKKKVEPPFLAKLARLYRDAPTKETFSAAA